MTTTSDEKEKRGRGRVRKVNPQFSRRVDDPLDAILIKVRGRGKHSIRERHENLLRMGACLEVREATYWWYPATLVSACAERVMYIQVKRDDHSFVKRQASRYGLSIRTVPSLPFIGAVEAPVIEEGALET